MCAAFSGSPRLPSGQDASDTLKRNRKNRAASCSRGRQACVSRTALVLCPTNTWIPINPILCNSHQKGNKTKWRVINCRHRIIEYIPDSSEFPFRVGINENGIHHLQFPHPMPGRFPTDQLLAPYIFGFVSLHYLPAWGDGGGGDCRAVGAIGPCDRSQRDIGLPFTEAWGLSLLLNLGGSVTTAEVTVCDFQA